MTSFILFIIGICFGSFINVLIDRIPAGKSVMYGRSQCDFCKKPLGVFDLFPVVSFIFLGGKCRYCHHKLSWQYPIVELLIGCSFLAVFFLEMPVNTFQFVYYALDVLLVSLGIALVIMDIKYRILSDILLIAFTLLSLTRVFLDSSLFIAPHIAIGLISMIPLLLLFIFSKGRGMGFGDVKLVGALGFLLGFPAILIVYYVAFLTGAMTGVILILVQKKGFRGTTIAFGPFLFLGAIVACLWGNYLWEYAKRFIGF